MRNKLYALLFCITLFLSTSCNDYLDMEPDDRLTEEMVFNDYKRTQEWLAALYSTIPDPLMQYTREWGCTFLSDDAQIALPMGQFNDYWKRTVSFYQGSMNATLTPPARTDVWGDTYKQVRSAYIFMKNVKPLPAQGLTKEDVEQMKMEARFLITYYYTKMLELYGPFPLVTELISPDTPIADLMLARTPYEEILAWLDNEYKELAAFFPAHYEDSNTMTGRPTKGICLALRARLWLYAASPLFNGNDDYKDIKNPDGTPLFTQSYDAGKWKKAVDATREFLNLAESGEYELYIERYSKNGEIDPFLSFQNLFLKSQGNKEIIFVHPDAGNRVWYNAIGNPRGFAGNSGYYGSTQSMADAFFMKNGLSPISGYDAEGKPIINPESGYTEEGFTKEAIHYENTAYALADEKSTPGLIVNKGCYNMYANREPRFYITLWYHNEWHPKAKRTTDFMDGGQDGGPTHDAPQCGYLVRKGVNPEGDPRQSKVPYQPGIILRLGEFYLNYAEALNEYEPGNPEILKYVNLIRQRAGIPTYGTGANQIQPPTTQAGIRELIRKERRAEFGAEGDVRYNDIRRWKIAVDIFKDPIMGMNKFGKNNNDFYKRVSYTSRIVEKKFYLWPIYQNYIDNNSNLVQNLDW